MCAPLLTDLCTKITVYHMIRHVVTSLDDEEPVQDLICCMPLAYGQQCFDTVLATGRHGQSIQPARLHLVFTFVAHSVIWQAAVVSYFEPLPLTAKDCDINMHHY